MTARCDICKSYFNSHDGGVICNVCDKVYCHKCEPSHFRFELTGDDTCNACNVWWKRLGRALAGLFKERVRL